MFIIISLLNFTLNFLLTIWLKNNFGCIKPKKINPVDKININTFELLKNYWKRKINIRLVEIKTC